MALKISLFYSFNSSRIREFTSLMNEVSMLLPNFSSKKLIATTLSAFIKLLGAPKPADTYQNKHEK